MSARPTAFEATPFARYADRAQAGLTQHFGGARAGSLRSSSPVGLRQLAAFDYWWLAHAVEVRVDAYERSGWSGWLVLARQTYAGIRRRNRASLFNSYFDDMSWLTIAALRLHDATGDEQYLRDAVALWQRIAQRGVAPASDRHGRALSWRVKQPGYVNAPTNGAFGIASERLFEREGSPSALAFADSSRLFLEQTLRDPTTGIVADGFNRTAAGAVDDDWIFSYNQGLYIGLKAAAFRRTGDRAHLADALQTAASTVDRLTEGGIFTTENVNHAARGGGDLGLFKGIFYRYLADLLSMPEVLGMPDLLSMPEALGVPGADDTNLPDAVATPGPRTVPDLVAALRAATDTLWQTFAPSRLADDDWRRFATPPVALSTELSAVMALEARSRFETALAVREAS